MARRTFAVVDVNEILIHWQAGQSKFEVAASLGACTASAAVFDDVWLLASSRLSPSTGAIPCGDQGGRLVAKLARGD